MKSIQYAYGADENEDESDSGSNSSYGEEVYNQVDDIIEEDEDE